MIKVSVEDFGPIIKGTVELKPLTIFIGPSNAGKSYMAMLIYSLMQSVQGYPSYPFGTSYWPDSEEFGFRWRLRNVDSASGFGLDETSIDAIRRWVKNIDMGPLGEPNFDFASLPREVQSFTNESIKTSWQSIRQSLSRELQRCHGHTSSLERRAAGETRLRIGLEQDRPLLRLSFGKEAGSDQLETLREDLDLSQEQVGVPRRLIDQLQFETERHRDPREDRGLEYVEFMIFLVRAASASLFRELQGNSYYLPAARSGIAQGHKAIASILVRQSSLAGVRPLEIPTLSGIITDFISHILTMEREDWLPGVLKLDEVADFLEREVVRGRIDIEKSAEITYPEISYEPLEGQPDMGIFPFHKTSSMVSELAPVILFLKYLVRRGDMVILEEPESHLHPASQRQMARGIARLVNMGVKVIITTHSDYFIGQINNLLKLSRASRQKRTKEGYAAEDCLKSDDVSAYHFRMDNSQGGSRVEELPITPDFGIDEQEFAKVSEALYEETISLQRIRGG